VNRKTTEDTSKHGVSILVLQIFVLTMLSEYQCPRTRIQTLIFAFDGIEMEEKSYFKDTKVDLYSMFVSPFTQWTIWAIINDMNSIARVHLGVCSESGPGRRLFGLASTRLGLCG